jgi:uncharacterized membrane protein
MERLINHSWLSLEEIYDHYRWLNYASVNHYQFFTIVWNILLIIIPLGIYFFLDYYWLKTKLIKIKEKITAVILFIFWLLFFPNAAYLISDVRHLLNYCPADSPYQVCLDNAWMIIFFFTYSILGWVSFYYLLKSMSILIGKIFGKIWSDIFAVLMVPLSSLGLLLGLLNRFNSLDVILYPQQFLKTLWLYVSNINYLLNWLVFTLFLYLLYFIGDVIFRKINR